MIHTHVCELLGIEYPIIQAGMGPFTSAELAAAVSNAGGLGSLGAGARVKSDFRLHLARLGELTLRPYAVNFTLSGAGIDEETFALTLEARPRLISFALGDPGDYVKRAHDAGSLVMLQVTTVQQARQAAERGVDLIIAQGTEAGGFGGTVAALALIPQVVDAVSPIPVIAAGGIADGRGLAAALVLGAQGVNIGTRFLASSEAPIPEAWKQAILGAESQEAIKAEFWAEAFPATGSRYPSTPRVLRSAFVDAWLNRPKEVGQEAKRLQAEVGAAIDAGKFGELLPFTGQTAGLIHEILPAAEIVRRLVAEAEAAFDRTAVQAHQPAEIEACS
jgi:nitronate monooxygenase/enoyl-[acyl-carrier protein] reductase II